VRKFFIVFLVTLGVLCALPAIGAQDSDDRSVRFVQPKHLQTILGPTTFEAEVDLPAGLEVRQLLFAVDGVAVAALESPPWKIDWDAGDSGIGYRLEVIARLSDGTEISQVIATTVLRINQRADVDLVSLYPVVRDRSGHYVTDLTKDDFLVKERGTQQTVSRFTTARLPLRVGIVLDTSLSMAKGNRLEDAQQAALGFLDSLEPDDEGMVVTFNERVRVAQDFTADRTPLGAAILATNAHGGTALYDAVWRTSRMLRDLDARRVIVLLSDGRDEATSGFEPGSLHTLEEALDQALRSEVMVFAIGLGKNLDTECTQNWSMVPSSQKKGCPHGSLQDVLARLADSTGGRLMLSQSSRRLRKAFDDIASDLRNQYSLAYTSSNSVKDGTWRPIEISVKDRPGALVISRDGYFATP
jgi:Ca-activated chloride channel family protein